MRRSRSLLKNYSNPQGAHPGGYAPNYNTADTMAHAHQIQQRLDQYGYPAPNMLYPPHPPMEQPYGAYPQGYGHMPQHQHQPQHQPPAPPQPQPFQQDWAQPSDSGMGNIKANLDQLAAKISNLTQMQQNNSQPRSEYEQLKQQLQLVARSVGELQNGFSSLQQKSVQSNHILGLKDAIDQNYHEILSRMEMGAKSDIDPNAYAQVVESSHAEILAQIKQIQAEMNASSVSPENLIGTVESGYLDVSSKIEQLANQLNQIDQPQANEELVAIRSQLDTLGGSVEALAAREVELPVPDFSNVEMRLEEVNRAIVALSSVDQGTDNLERIEARLIELSRELEPLKAAEAHAKGAEPDFSGLENHFLETNNTLREIEARLTGQMNDDGPAVGALSDELKLLSDKVDNISVAAGSEFTSELKALGDKVDNITVVSGTGDQEENPALLQRLDELVERVEQLKDPQIKAEDGSETALLQSLQEQVLGISEQLGSFNASGLSLDPVTDGLGNLEQQVGTGFENIQGQLQSNFGNIEQQLSASRDISIELAAGAAEEAVRRVMQEFPMGGSSADNEAINALQQDLQKLHETLSPSANNEIVFDELKDTMANIADRIASLETNVQDMMTSANAMPAAALMGGAVSETHYADTGFAQPEATQMPQPTPIPEPVVDQQQDYVEAVPQEQQIPEQDVSLVPSDTVMLESAPVEEAGYNAPEPHEHEAVPQPYEAQPMPVAETMGTPEYHYEQGSAEAEHYEKPESEMSAGERLVRAARLAENERQRAKQNYQDEFATRKPDAGYQAVEAQLEPAMAQEHAQQLPDMAAPEMAPAEIPETVSEHQPAVVSPPEVAEDAPLEPGSDGPDLASLVRRANERSKSVSSRQEAGSGTDFLAAARKAAQAAAQEASAVEAEEQPETEQKSKSLLGSLPSLLGRKKKALVIAAATALLLAFAMPIVSKFAVTGDDSANIAQVTVDEQQTGPELAALETDEPERERVTVVSDFAEEDASPELEQVIPADEELPAGVSNEYTASVAAPATVSLGVPEFENPFDFGKVNFVSDALKIAAEQNDPAAIFEIARRYTNGIGTEKNLEEAAKWYEHSANLGYVPAQYLIGNFNEKGIGVAKDRTLAEAWYEQAAENGHVVAMHNLAVINASPDPATGRSNHEKAIKWFSKAAEYGVRDSQVNLGIFLAKGTGVPVNLVEAYKWFAIAAKSGDDDAAQKRDFIADAMRPDQLEGARKLVEDWKQAEADAVANRVNVPASWKSEEDKHAVLTDRNSIAQAQLLLNKIGFDVGPADGVLGQRTRDAITSFRAKSGLAVNDRLDVEFLETLKAVSI